jgi:pSer/pThr/pTyr-binding forkhead associated (FHA) protein
MGKLVIRCRGKIVGEVNLRLGDMKIGRKTGDIVLDDPAVSGAHAVITTVGNSSTVYDLDSTNGTYVGGQRVKKHELVNGQTVIIGEHSLLYSDELAVGAPTAIGVAAGGSSSTMMIQFAHLMGIEGREKGKRVSLTKESVTLENPGKNPSRVTRMSDRYLLEEADPGDVTLNGHPMPKEGGVLLEDGDIIEIGGTKFQFHLK